MENKPKAVGGGAINKAKTHCANGHEYTPENTRMVKRGTSRGCRQCQIIHYQKYKELYKEKHLKEKRELLPHNV